MTTPADINVLDDDVQLLVSDTWTLQRAPAIIIGKADKVTGPEILYNYNGSTNFQQWYTLNNKPWQFNDTYIRGFEIGKDEHDTIDIVDYWMSADDETWSLQGSLQDLLQVHPAGGNLTDDVLNMSTDDMYWGIKLTSNPNGGDIYKFCSYGDSITISNISYKLCGIAIYAVHDLPNLNGAWNDVKDYGRDEQDLVLYFSVDELSDGEYHNKEAFNGLTSREWDFIAVSPVYMGGDAGDNTGTVNFLQGRGIIINSFPDFTSKQYPELINKGELFEELVEKTDTDLFASIYFNPGNYDPEELTVNSVGDANNSASFEVYKERGYDAYVTEFGHVRTEKYNFLGYVLTAMDDPGGDLTENPLCWFAPYKEDTIEFTDINYSKITDMGWSILNPYNYIRAVWLHTTAWDAYSHCVIDTNREEYSDIVWAASYSISSTSKTFYWSHNNTGVSEGTFLYNGSNRPSINIDTNSLADDDEFTLTLSKVECEQEIIRWELWNINNEPFIKEQNPSFVINGKTLREISHNAGVLLYVVPVINPIQSITFKYTNNTAWDVVVQVGEKPTTLDRWSTGTASITAESSDDVKVIFENESGSRSVDFNDFYQNNTITLNYNDAKLYNALRGLTATYDILVFLPIYKTNVFMFDFSTGLGFMAENISSSVNADEYISITDESITVTLGEGEDLEQQANLVLGGYLNFNFDSCTTFNKNEELNVINYNYPPHVLDSPNKDDSTLTPVEHKVGASEKIQYWEHTDSVWGDDSPYHDNNYKYNGNGIYAFIINMDDYSPDEKVIFDYKEYNCGTLLGYITSRDNDSQNTVLKNESEFLFGVVAPAADNIVTIYGFDTNNSELYLLEDLVGDDPTETCAAIINWGDGSGVGYEAYSKIYNWAKGDFSTSLPIDNSTYQTGNQFVVFRLRNPYDGKVLNHDEDAAYGVTTKYGNTSETHEQPYFLTIWEQRSIFNALNNKITLVNEVSNYEEVQIIDDYGGLSLGGGHYDERGEINEDTAKDYGVDLTVCSLLRNSRKSGRALVDNIDDWFNWFKREEEPGIIANSQDNTLAGGSPLMFVAPMLNDDYGCCIQSDAVQTSKTLGPGESISVPIVVLYKAYPEQNRDAVKYTIGFDIRNSLYLDPLYYQFTLNAKYSGSVSDSISSQKASIQSSTKYNVTVR